MLGRPGRADEGRDVFPVSFKACYMATEANRSILATHPLSNG